MNIELIRDLIAKGMTNNEIMDAIADMECEDIDLDDDLDCSEYDDTRSELNERFDMGRNANGEWLGFC